jgi:hypothetical protein
MQFAVVNRSGPWFIVMSVNVECNGGNARDGLRIVGAATILPYMLLSSSSSTQYFQPARPAFATDHMDSRRSGHDDQPHGNTDSLEPSNPDEIDTTSGRYFRFLTKSYLANMMAVIEPLCLPDNILTDLRMLRNNLILNRRETPLRQVMKYLQTVLQHCTVLETDPSAFENNEERETFFSSLRLALDDIATVLELWQESDEILADVLEKTIAKRSAETRPSYAANLRPWNQFLNHKAPGVPTLTAPTQSQKPVRLIPPAGLAILARWKADHQSLARTVTTVS